MGGWVDVEYVLCLPSSPAHLTHHLRSPRCAQTLGQRVKNTLMGHVTDVVAHIESTRVLTQLRTEFGLRPMSNREVRAGRQGGSPPRCWLLA